MMKEFKLELKWALIFTAMTLLWMVGEKAAGLHDRYLDKHLILTNLIAIPALLIYYLAMREKKKAYYGGVMSFREGMRFGLVMSLIIALLAPLAQYVISTWITPDYFPNVIKMAVAQQKMTQEQAEAYFSLGNYMKQAAYGSLIMGIVTSAVMAAILRTRESRPA